VTLFSVLYMLMDLGKLSPKPIAALTVVGFAVAAVVAWRALRRGESRGRASLDAASIALPHLACAVVIVLGALFAYVTRRLGSPVKGPGGSYSTETGFFGGLNNSAEEDSADFGAVGAVILLAVPVVTAVQYRKRRLDSRHLALACALPLFLLVLALGSKFDVWLGRFLIVPVALTAPLFALFFRGRAATAAYVAVGVLAGVWTVTGDRTKGVRNPLGPPWSLTREGAVAEAQAPAALGFRALQGALPSGGCVGALLSSEDPSYLLGGNGFERRVVYLPQSGAVGSADGLGSVVITKTEVRTEAQRRAVEEFRAAGWRIVDLGGFWWLAVRPGANPADCP
jgi:hypothetical protein